MAKQQTQLVQNGPAGQVGQAERLFVVRVDVFWGPGKPGTAATGAATSSASTGKVGAACSSITWLTGNRIQVLHPLGFISFHLISTGKLQNQ